MRTNPTRHLLVAAALAGVALLSLAQISPQRGGFSVSTPIIGSRCNRCMRSTAVRMVNCSMVRPSVTSFHSSGIDTGACGNGRTQNGATSNFPCPFCR